MSTLLATVTPLLSLKSNVSETFLQTENEYCCKFTVHKKTLPLRFALIDFRWSERSSAPVCHFAFFGARDTFIALLFCWLAFAWEALIVMMTFMARLLHEISNFKTVQPNGRLIKLEQQRHQQTTAHCYIDVIGADGFSGQSKSHVRSDSYFLICT
ncbi:hypothetical protein T01_3582 [Trichinella spiralis]|uniref:Uncharacterized protein n=1 Tax=Trichinella spiralis TaxID=6334 RepID=A0A0V1AXK1_TRISP|nr:hypothetical protein T01_3582 [Trichinella spiralis]